MDIIPKMFLTIRYENSIKSAFIIYCTSTLMNSDTRVNSYKNSFFTLNYKACKKGHFSKSVYSSKHSTTAQLQGKYLAPDVFQIHF